MSNIVKQPLKAVSQVSGDITKSMQDVATLGNRDLVNSASGGGLDALQGASQGNSKDLFRTGATVAAFAGAGPAGAVAVNQQFAQGQSPEQIALGLASGGTGVNFLDQALTYANNPAVQGLLGLNKPAPAPKAPKQVAPTVTPSVQPSEGMSMTTMLLIAGGVIATVLVGFVVFKGKK